MRRFTDAGEDLFGDLDKIDELDDVAAAELQRVVTDMRLKCEELDAALTARVGA